MHPNIACVNRGKNMPGLTDQPTYRVKELYAVIITPAQSSRDYYC